MSSRLALPRFPRIGTRFWLSLCSLALVLWLFALNLERTSPGPLAEPHAREAGLAEKDACDDCHGGWGQSMASACGECHERVGAELAEGHGFHGGLAEAAECAVCHREHRGADFRMVSDLGFRQAGFASREDYDHAGLGFELAGRHAELGCTACHENADVPVIEKGAARFVGLEQRCDACHDDPHGGRMRRDCAACHGQDEPFSAVATFEHSDVFPLVGAHAEPSCRECHAESGPTSVEALSGPRPPSAVRTCAECHESPHRGEFLAAGARLAGAPPGESCVVCHGGVDGSFAGSEALMPRELHAAAGFALEGAHAAVDCADCHGEPGASWGRGGSALAGVAALAGLGGGASFAERFPGRSPEACSVCHEDPHAGQFAAAGSAFAGRECSACHAGGGFLPPTFGLADHARTGFPLDGGHAAVGCRDCHTVLGAGADEIPGAIPDAANPRRFRGTARACEACHEDAHFGRFDAGLAARPDADGCALCHVTSRFDDVALASAPADGREHAPGGARLAVFDHALWTGFALEGAHARAECASCHPSTRRSDALGRRFGRVHEAFGRPVGACSTCHADVHDGAFDEPAPAPGATKGATREATAEAGRGASDCSRCHDTESFSAVAAADFDHGRWTGFPLDGAHLAADCESCHVRSPAPDARGRTFGSVAATFGAPADRCETCHRDVHFGAFDEPGLPARFADGEGCARCHATSAFRPTVRPFDHGLWAGYRLAPAHASLDCAACHASAPLENGPGQVPGRVLGRVAGRSCRSCHASPHVGQFADRDRGGRTDCERCHVAEGSFAELVFDHDRDSRFPLDATHRALECAACHRPWPLPGGGEAVRYKPLGTTCNDCHGIEVGREKGQ